MPSIFENLRQVLLPKPSASARVTLPLPIVQVEAFQQAKALLSCAWVSVFAALVKASFRIGFNEL